ncbi:MAG TPA: outer membrane lipoprotein carrier protein LolA [Vicinamibacterales bacterium]|nr:outer membrane lipoprotein carrier protein LolA [Vicinamibacterales bacterium]
MSLIALSLALSLSPSPAQLPETGASATEVAGALQRKYNSIRDFSADFLHQHEGGAVRRKREERGTLLVKKPGKMRWTYKAPDAKVFVSNGTRLYQYFPEDNRVIMGDAPGDTQPAVRFLSGRGDLTRDFNVTFGKTVSDGSWTLRLEPKQPQAEYDWLEITASRDALRLQSLTVGEKTGSRSTFTFTNFKENPGLADNAFEFSIPKGAEVTNAGPVKR